MGDTHMGVMMFFQDVIFASFWYNQPHDFGLSKLFRRKQSILHQVIYPSINLKAILTILCQQPWLDEVVSSNIMVTTKADLLESRYLDLVII